MTGATITLCEVCPSLAERLCQLEVADSQRSFVASNRQSLEDWAGEPDAVALAVCVEHEPVGFLMYERLADAGRLGAYSIYRFMIDARHQGLGYGRAAIAQLLDRMREDPRLKRITICYLPYNEAARRLYAGFGFREIGLDDEVEMIAELTFDNLERGAA